MKCFVGDDDARIDTDKDRLDGRDKAKVTVALLIGGALMLAGATISELFYAAFYALIAVGYLVQRLRLRRREARRALAADRSRGSR
jgi:hypothetical protein